MKKAETWLLVCDASRARLFSFDPKKDALSAVDRIDNPAGRARTHEIVSDKPGQVRQSGRKGQLAAMAAPTDPADVEMQRFARRLGKLLEKGFDDHRFGRLVLVAPPRFLGLLRDELSAPVARCVHETVDKSLVTLEERDLLKRLRSHLAPRA